MGSKGTQAIEEILRQCLSPRLLKLSKLSVSSFGVGALAVSRGYPRKYCNFNSESWIRRHVGEAYQDDKLTLKISEIPVCQNNGISVGRYSTCPEEPGAITPWLFLLPLCSRSPKRGGWRAEIFGHDSGAIHVPEARFIWRCPTKLGLGDLSALWPRTRPQVPKLRERRSARKREGASPTPSPTFRSVSRARNGTTRRTSPYTHSRKFLC